MGEGVTVFFPPPCEATEIHHVEQKNRDDRRKDLQKKKAKAETCKPLTKKRDETRYFAAKG